MVQIKCELCGSNDFLKQDDYFVCQHCGCKYTVEQARKMQIDGVVNVEGEVKIDSSKKLENLYVIARRSRSNNDWDAAKRYYDLVLQEDPLSWEALFYLAYFDAYYCKNGELRYKSDKLCNCINNVAELIGTSQMSLKEKFDAFQMIGKDVEGIANSLISRAKSFRNSMLGIKAISPASLIGAGKDIETYRNTVIPMINCKNWFSDGIEKVINQFEDFPELKQLMCALWISAMKDTIELFGKRIGESNKNIILQYKEKVKKYMPEYSDEEINQCINGEYSSINGENRSGTSKLRRIFNLLSFILGLSFAFINMICLICSIDLYYDETYLGCSILFGLYSIVPMVFGIISLSKGTTKKAFSIIGIIASAVSIIFTLIIIISFI